VNVTFTSKVARERHIHEQRARSGAATVPCPA
jgi:hypothetical protein